MMKRMKALVASVLLTAVFTSCHLRQTRYVSPSFEVETIHSVLVLPRGTSRFDIQIAARVSQQLDQAGISLADVNKLAPMPRISTVDACRQAEQFNYQAVVFVDWNSLLMVECKSQSTAFSMVGSEVNAPGIDKFTAELVKYLHRTPRTN
jgi:hypothetical protein